MHDLLATLLKAAAPRKPHWDPSEHPRDAAGRFIEVGDLVTLPDGQRGTVVGNEGGKLQVRVGTSGKVSVDPKQVNSKESSLSGMRPATDEDRRALRLPPAWTDVLVADTTKNPAPKILAVGRDAKGREQRVYSQEHADAQAVAKFQRVRALSEVVPQLDARLQQDKDTNDSAAATYLIRHLGLRPGSTTDTGADKQAYGATTLLNDHVQEDEDGLHLRFTGKKGVDIDFLIEDEGVAELLRSYKSKTQPGARLFPNTSDARVRDYIQSVIPGFKAKDFRTHVGTGTALAYLDSFMPPIPDTPKELEALKKRVAEAVSQRLGNTPKVALESYIDPTVFERFTPVSTDTTKSAGDTPVTDMLDDYVRRHYEVTHYAPDPGDTLLEDPDPDDEEVQAGNEAVQIARRAILGKAVTRTAGRNIEFERKHPRGRDGRFIRLGGLVSLPSGGTATVVSINDNGDVHTDKGDFAPGNLKTATPKPSALTREAGARQTAALAPARKKWLQRVARNVLASTTDDDPEREYWEGVANPEGNLTEADLVFKPKDRGYYTTADGKYAVMSDGYKPSKYVGADANFNPRTGEGGYEGFQGGEWAAVHDPRGRLNEDGSAGENLDWFPTKQQAEDYARQHAKQNARTVVGPAQPTAPVPDPNPEPKPQVRAERVPQLEDRRDVQSRVKTKRDPDAEANWRSGNGGKVHSAWQVTDPETGDVLGWAVNEDTTREDRSAGRRYVNSRYSVKKWRWRGPGGNYDSPGLGGGEYSSKADAIEGLLRHLAEVREQSIKYDKSTGTWTYTKRTNFHSTDTTGLDEATARRKAGLPPNTRFKPDTTWSGGTVAARPEPGDVAPPVKPEVPMPAVPDTPAAAPNPEPSKLSNAAMRFPKSGFAPLISELNVIASDELADVLEEQRSSGKVTGANLDKLSSYLREELEPGGALTSEHMRQADPDRPAANRNGVENQARKLLERSQAARGIIPDAAVEPTAADPASPQTGQKRLPKLTAAAVRNALISGRHTPTASHSTSVRGWHSITNGFKVDEGGGVITVRYVTDRGRGADRQDKQLDAYADALRAAGFEVERFPDHIEVRGDNAKLVETQRRKYDEQKRNHEFLLASLKRMEAASSKAYREGNTSLASYYQREITRERNKIDRSAQTLDQLKRIVDGIDRREREAAAPRSKPVPNEPGLFVDATDEQLADPYFRAAARAAARAMRGRYEQSDLESISENDPNLTVGEYYAAHPLKVVADQRSTINGKPSGYVTFQGGTSVDDRERMMDVIINPGQYETAPVLETTNGPGNGQRAAAIRGDEYRGIVQQEVGPADEPTPAAPKPGRAVTGTYFHGTSPENAASIRSDGFDVERTMGPWGPGVYMVADEDRARDAYGGEAVPVQVNLKNAATEDIVIPIAEEVNSDLGIDPETVRRQIGDRLREQGYDGVVATVGGREWVVAFDTSGAEITTPDEPAGEPLKLEWGAKIQMPGEDQPWTVKEVLENGSYRATNPATFEDKLFRPGWGEVVEAAPPEFDTPLKNQKVDVTDEQAKAIGAHVNESYDVNRRLRLAANGDRSELDAAPAAQRRVNEVNAAVDANRTNADATVYRGVTDMTLAQFLEQQPLSEGDTLRDPALVSAAADPQWVRDYLDRHYIYSGYEPGEDVPEFTMVITVPEGTNAVYIPAFKANRQTELLFGTDHPMRVDRIDLERGELHLTALPDRGANDPADPHVNTEPTPEPTIDTAPQQDGTFPEEPPPVDAVTPDIGNPPSVPLKGSIMDEPRVLPAELKPGDDVWSPIYDSNTAFTRITGWEVKRIQRIDGDVFHLTDAAGVRDIAQYEPDVRVPVYRGAGDRPPATPQPTETPAAPTSTPRDRVLAAGKSSYSDSYRTDDSPDEAAVSWAETWLSTATGDPARAARNNWVKAMTSRNTQSAKRWRAVQLLHRENLANPNSESRTAPRDRGPVYGSDEVQRYEPAQIKLKPGQDSRIGHYAENHAPTMLKNAGLDLDKLPLDVTFAEYTGRKATTRGRYNDSTGEVMLAVRVAGSPRSVVTAAHEIGHHIDYRILPRLDATRGFTAPSQNSPALARFRDAVNASNAVLSLHELKRQPQSDTRYINYLLSDKELWARAFAQWVVSRQPDTRSFPGQAKEYLAADTFEHKQWTVDDFAPIDEAITQLFKELGYLKEAKLPEQRALGNASV